MPPLPDRAGCGRRRGFRNGARTSAPTGGCCPWCLGSRGARRRTAHAWRQLAGRRLGAWSQVPVSLLRDRSGMTVTLFLGGDVMTGRGVDQILRHPSAPDLREAFVRDARDYVDLAELVNGPIPRPV